MTRSRNRKLHKNQRNTIKRGARSGSVARLSVPVASALLACMQATYAADAGNAVGALQEIVVTAQKRTENMQNVPISLQAIDTRQLERLHVSNFDDYVKYLPSVSFQSAGPSFEHTYMRGVASGGDGNHSGSLPSVGMYLDEQPVTTIDGNLNVHIYDIARVESLSGPQGTLYGASSEAGTIRIITNKPDAKKFAAGYDLDVNSVSHGGVGYTGEGYVNLPLAANAAVRLVGWDEKDAGYIDNVHSVIQFPGPNGTTIPFDNAAQVRNHYNDVETRGGRAALRVELNDTWTVTPTVMGQTQTTNGNFAYNPQLGDLQIAHFLPDTVHDSWVQSALTVEGRLNDFDITYAGAYLTRNTHELSDYTDYTLAYDVYYGFNGYGTYFRDNAGNPINPAQQIIGRDHYTKTSNELRISTPKENRARLTAGLFMERQVHNILQDYLVNNGDPLASTGSYDISVPGWPGSIWLTDQQRVDRDQAAFAEFSYDITPKLTGTLGARYYTYDNTLQGFYGFSANYSSHEGVATCFNPNVPWNDAPCEDLNGRSTGSGMTPKVNLTYKIAPEKMVYATFSKGFRPGGVNRNGGGSLPPYKPDYLTNYEVGWKTQWDDNRLRWNGAIFWDKWKDFQFSYLGPNALTIIANAGQAQIKGIETDAEFRATEQLTLSGGFSYLDAKLTQEYCSKAKPTTLCDVSNEQYAPSGEQLPVTPKFKGNLTARYTFPIGSLDAHLQGSAVYVGPRWADLRLLARNLLGQEPSYTLADFAFGVAKDSWHAELYVNNAFDKRAVLDRYSECDVATCGSVAIYNVPNQPRTVGVKFGQSF
ncbi:MAG: TonB-dependent receptor [Gammaproteobacteria bacterium]|nr:TonB-dependent receptor [Gammaproteobacteria bacterium]